MKYIILSCLVLWGCNPKSEKITYQTSNGQFIEVLTDLYVAEQVVKKHSAKKDSVRSALLDQIMEIHEIQDTGLFLSELEMLMDDSELYFEISDSVVKRLEVLEKKPKPQSDN